MDTVLDIERLAEMIGRGHSRVPIWESHPHNVRGYLILKNLIVLSPTDRRVVRTLGLRQPLVVPLDYPLLDLLSDFQKGKSHIAIVSNQPDTVKRAWRGSWQIPAGVHMAGLISLEDILEHLLQDEIFDESGVGEGGVRTQLDNLTFRNRRIAKLKKLAKRTRAQYEGRATAALTSGLGLLTSVGEFASAVVTNNNNENSGDDENDGSPSGKKSVAVGGGRKIRAASQLQIALLENKKLLKHSTRSEGTATAPPPTTGGGGGVGIAPVSGSYSPPAVPGNSPNDTDSPTL